MLTASQVAAMLGIKARTVYALASAGELAHHRFGGAVRFDPADIEAYKLKCRSPATTQIAGTSNLTASSPGGEHALTSYFRKAGREPRRKPTTSARQRVSTRLQLVETSRHR